MVTVAPLYLPYFPKGAHAPLIVAALILLSVCLLMSIAPAAPPAEPVEALDAAPPELAAPPVLPLLEPPPLLPHAASAPPRTRPAVRTVMGLFKLIIRPFFPVLVRATERLAR